MDYTRWLFNHHHLAMKHPWDDPDADDADDAVAGLGFGYERLDPIQGPHAKPSGPGPQGDLESTIEALFPWRYEGPSILCSIAYGTSALVEVNHRSQAIFHSEVDA
jgi:hypothetical protein